MSNALGWQIRRVTLTDGRSAVLTPTPKNLPWCRRLVHILYDDRDVGDCDYFVEPVGGWSALAGDPLAALLYHVAAGDVSPDAALGELRKLIPAAPADGDRAAARV